jgi:hypothetical protein
MSLKKKLQIAIVNEGLIAPLPMALLKLIQ